MSNEYYKSLLNSVDFAVAEHEMIYDDLGNPIDYKFLYVNKAFCASLNMNEDSLIGKTVLEVLPQTEDFWIARYYEVVSSGKSANFINFSSALDQYFSVYAYCSKPNCFVTSFKNITSYIKIGSPEVKTGIIENVFQGGKTAFFEFDLKNKSFNYSDTLPEIIGRDIVTYEDYVNLFLKYTHPADKRRVENALENIFKKNKNESAIQLRFYNSEANDYIWISFFAYVDKRLRNIPIIIKGLLKDIDKEKKQSLFLEQMNRMFKETRKIANITTFYYDFSEEKFRASKELDEFLGLDKTETVDQIRAIVHPDDVEKYDYSTNEIENHPEGLVSNYRIIRNDETRYIQSSVFGEFDEIGNVYAVFGIMKDVTKQEINKQEIQFFANHDVLTGLYNRNNFERFNKSLNYKNNVCVLICDVDGLKLVNDAFGHIEGDELLIHLAEVLKDVGGKENVYRIGGDEFVIVIYDANEYSPIEMEQKIKAEIKKFRMYGVGFDASIGYGFIDEDKTFEDAFRNAENLMYRRKLTERKSRKSNALNMIMQTMHEKTEETEEHCHRVGELAAELLRQAGKKRDYEIEEIKLVADVHDIGKISISDQLLSKPNRLTDLEYEQIKYHSESGYKIISNIIDNEDIAVAVLYHHERYDGNGYPHGLKGENIPLYSRIISICDAYDAMTSNRVYRDALTKKQALKEIKRNAGTQFDPDLVEKFLKIVK